MNEKYLVEFSSTFSHLPYKRIEIGGSKKEVGVSRDRNQWLPDWGPVGQGCIRGETMWPLCTSAMSPVSSLREPQRREAAPFEQEGRRREPLFEKRC